MSGQATVEYVLVLIVVLVIILGLVFQFNDAFRNYARNYFGAYLQCLLEQGELPNLGAQNAGSTCDQEFQPFNIATGRVPLFDGASRTPGQLGTNARGNQNPKEESEGDGPTSASGGNDADGGGRPSRFSSSSSGSASIGGSLRPSRFQDGGSSSDEKTADGGSKGPTTRRVVRRNADGTPLRGERQIVESGRQTYFEASKVEEEALKEDKSLSQERFEQTAQTRKQTFEQQTQNRKIQSVEEESLTFSNFLRYLLIAAVLIAVILFLAGQFMSISKSMEK